MLTAIIYATILTMMAVTGSFSFARVVPRLRQSTALCCASSSPSTTMFSTTLGASGMNKTAEDCRSLLICGPSGAGKGTLITKLLAKYPETLSLSVSHTTRAPRPGEVEGLHYHFVAYEKMAADIASQESNTRPAGRKFLEHAEVHKNLYGTSLKAVQNIWTKGKLAILDVDTKGVQQIRNSKSVLAKYIFIVPPNIPELRRRLENRGTETPAQIETRLANAEGQLQFAKDNHRIWDLVLLNDNLDLCAETLEGVLKAWFPSYLSSGTEGQRSEK